MGISVFPLPSAASKTLKKVTLTSGTSYTVPAGVTEINVLLVGGGGGAAKVVPSYYSTGIGEGHPGQTVWSTITTSGGSSINYSIGAGGTGGSVNTGGTGGNTTMTGATTANGGNGGVYDGSALAASYSFANNGGKTPCAVDGGGNGGAGGQGYIEVEYWS